MIAATSAADMTIYSFAHSLIISWLSPPIKDALGGPLIFSKFLGVIERHKRSFVYFPSDVLHSLPKPTGITVYERREEVVLLPFS